MTRLPSGIPPISVPHLPGYRYVRILDKGATSSVYLYEQEAPSRSVAVKASAYSHDAHELFLREANFLARLSTHPYILTIHQATVSEEGRDCLILDYASGGSCKALMRAGGLDEEQTLDLGVRMASALYSAHTKGIIHRDVKPGNFLITDQGLPVLGDFGISASTYGTADAVGLSIPWAAPEILARRSGGSEASDIYSLGASLFGMLTGRSPFEYGYRVANEDQLAQAIMHRDLPRLRQGEASLEFEQILDKAMARGRDDRYYTALDFGRAMQRLQGDSYGHTTPFIGEGVEPFPDDGRGGREDGSGINSNLNSPRGGTADRGSVRLSASRNLHGGSGRRPAWAGSDAATGQDTDEAIVSSRVRPALLAGAVLLVAALAALALWLFVLPDRDGIRPGRAVTDVGSGPSASAQQETDVQKDSVDRAPVPSVIDGMGAYQGSTVIFTWANPDPKAGDTYTWFPLSDQDKEGHGSAAQTQEPRAVISKAEESQTCISVSLVRADRRVSQEPTTICATQQ